MSLPVMLLAFANDRQSSGRYLRNLPVELNRLKEILDRAEDQGLCEVEYLPNATLSQIIAAFQKEKYRNRIAVFHFAGHADSYELLLEDEGGQAQVADAGGLVPFLSSQQGLKLIFLNGCLSAGQATALRDGGVPAVVGTVKAVDDAVAAKLSARFYAGLAEGLPISRAWREAVLALQAEKGSRGYGLYYQKGLAARDINWDEGVMDEGSEARFPWEIYFRDGAEAAQEWNLPAAAGDPYFGLPDLPERYGYPPVPYHFLESYRPEDARVFFGRGRHIRDLYYRISDPKGVPVIFFYGQSGAGKSSLLRAGLFPRLESSFEIRYARRDPARGLTGELLNVLGILEQDWAGEETAAIDHELQRDIRQLESTLEGLQGGAREQVERLLKEMQATQEQRQAPRAGLAEHAAQQWKALEEQSGKGLVVILDQAEECFTRPQLGHPDELERLFELLQHLFARPAERPRGKFLLSYRKDYDAEIENTARQYGLPKEKVYLDRLDKFSIVEVINGLASSAALHRQYRLEVEPALPVLIANDLLADRDSALAPVLQIILAKLWEKTAQEDQRRFCVADYLYLKEEGILLHDFYEQQMAQIKAWEAELQQAVESSGLALDVLEYHTTPLSTAASRSLEDLRSQYQHRSEILEALLQRFQSLYLLTAAGASRTGLAHDTLAPIVQQEARRSARPGQQARRILENKRLAYQQSPATTYLDRDDLRLVEAGAAGMRLWLPEEQALVEKSRRKRLQGNWLRGGAVALGLALLVLAALFAKNQTELSLRQRISELQNEAMLQEADGQPNAAFARIAEAYRQAPHDRSTAIIQHNIYADNEFFQRVYPLQENATAIASAADGSAFAVASGTAVLLMDTAGTVLTSLPHHSEILALAFSPDGSRLLTGAQDGYARLWARDGQLIRSWRAHQGQRVQAVAFSPEGRFCFTAGGDGAAVQWGEAGQAIRRFAGEHDGPVLSVACSPNGQQVLTGGEYGKAVLWPEQGPPLLLQGHTDRVLAVAFSPDGKTAITASRDNAINLWGVDDGLLRRQILGHQKRVNGLLAFEHPEQKAGLQPEERQQQWLLLSCSDDGSIKLWNQHGLELAAYRGHRGRVDGIALGPEAAWLLSAGEDQTVKRWPRRSKVLRSFGPHRRALSALAVSPDGAYLLTGTGSGVSATGGSSNDMGIGWISWILPSPSPQEANCWSLGPGGETVALSGHQKGINAVAIDPKGGKLLTGSDDSTAILWNRQGQAMLTLTEHRRAVLSVAFAPDTGEMLTGSADSTAILWSADGKLKARLTGHTDYIISVSFSPDGQWIATASYDGTFRLWRRSGEFVRSVLAHRGRAQACAFSPNSKYLLTGGWDNTARLWSLQGDSLLTVRVTEQNKTGGQAVNCVAFSPDSRFLLLGTEGGVAKIYTADGQLIQSVQDCYDTGVYAAAFSPDGARFFLAGGDGWAREYRFIGGIDE